MNPDKPPAWVVCVVAVLALVQAAAALLILFWAGGQTWQLVLQVGCLLNAAWLAGWARSWVEYGRPPSRFLLGFAQGVLLAALALGTVQGFPLR